MADNDLPADDELANTANSSPGDWSNGRRQDWAFRLVESWPTTRERSRTQGVELPARIQDLELSVLRQFFAHTFPNEVIGENLARDFLEMLRSTSVAIHGNGIGEDGRRGLDNDYDGRPVPLEDTALTVKLNCKICYTQLSDTVVLPCGHLVMCQVCQALFLNVLLLVRVNMY
jgi:hypothetical protein